jgi:phospholipid/cholesterol/gamma-HCH transport system permease protein
MKSVFFGMSIATTALLKGFAVERATTEIPVAGLRAVSASFQWCIVLDIALSALYYMLT